MQWLTEPHIWISLTTLTLLEIVLGIDNIIFISILAGRLPEHQQTKARTVGLSLALITRILLLCSIYWLTKLTSDLFQLFDQGFSGKDLVLLGGGIFLIWKSVHEIHSTMEGGGGGGTKKSAAGFGSVIIQIVMIDIVFSLDSVITAVGLVQEIGVMIAAVTLAMIVMLIASGPISQFVNRHPTIKMLALSFLLLVGVMLVAEGFGQHINRGYVYFAMAFSLVVEMLNMKVRRKTVTPAAATDSSKPS